ncbi:hypothetical protein Hanom_Chr03g00185851 [Helianthus anomalus]
MSEKRNSDTVGPCRSSHRNRRRKKKCELGFRVGCVCGSPSKRRRKPGFRSEPTPRCLWLLSPAI